MCVGTSGYDVVTDAEQDRRNKEALNNIETDTWKAMKNAKNPLRSKGVDGVITDNTVSNKTNTSGIRPWEAKFNDMMDGKITHFEEVIKKQMFELIKEKNYDCKDLLINLKNDEIVYPAALEMADALGLESFIVGYCLPGNKLTAPPLLADLKELGFVLKARYAIISKVQDWKNEAAALAEFNN